MTYPIPHLRDEDEADAALRATLAEAELASLRRLMAGRDQGSRMVAVTPPAQPFFHVPPSQTLPPLPAHPYPAYTPATCELVPTRDGFQRR